MGLASSWVLYTAIFAGALALRWVLLRVNKWVYEGRLKGKSYHLPPGDLGWPLIGNMWTFLRAFKTKNPDSFISNIVERFSLSLSPSLSYPGLISFLADTLTVLCSFESYGKQKSENLSLLLTYTPRMTS